MSKLILAIILVLLNFCSLGGQEPPQAESSGPPTQLASLPTGYFHELVEQLKLQWPKNRRIQLVFHGHSVPAGYFKTPEVRTYEAYPHLAHQQLCESFPTATIDVSVTAIGGENSEAGAARFERDVVSIRPDVVFIDYALNDRRLGLPRAEMAWRSMITTAKARDIQIVLLTPTPDQNVDLTDGDSPLEAHAQLIRRLAAEFHVPLVDSYRAFQLQVQSGVELASLMSQVNHPNLQGHRIVAELISGLFQSATATTQRWPDSIDLRPRFESYGLLQRCQGERGTCSVFTTVEAIEFAVAQCRGKGEALSVEFANWSANDCSGRSDDGDFFHNITAGVDKYGLCKESSMNYQASFRRDPPTEIAKQEAAEFRKEFDLRFHWLRDWKQQPGLRDSDIALIKSVLADGQPVCMGSSHSVLFVGYRDDAQAPGGGFFMIADSNLVEKEIDYQSAAKRFNDMFWVSASPAQIRAQQN